MDNNINGDGNNNHAKFWEYDMRLGRRWNLCPKSSSNINLYSPFGSDPIWHSDPLGDTVLVNGNQKNKAEYINELNNVSSTQFKLGKNGQLMVDGKINYDFKNGKSGELSRTIVEAINSRKNIPFNLVNNDSKVFFDSYKSAAFDIGDFHNISGNKGLEASLMGHIFAERFKAKSYTSSNTDVSDFNNSHNYALTIESLIHLDYNPSSLNVNLTRTLHVEQKSILGIKYYQTTFDYGSSKIQVISAPQVGDVLGTRK